MPKSNFSNNHPVKRTKQYEYYTYVKEPILTGIDKLNELGKQGWLVVACPTSNTFLLVREING